MTRKTIVVDDITLLDVGHIFIYPLGITNLVWEVDHN